MTQYAGFGQRLVAYIIDVIIVGVLTALSNVIFQDWLSGIIGLVAGWLYFAGLESSTRQATIGKSMLNIFVTDLNGNRITFIQATIRYFARILSAIILFIGYIMAAFTARKQALHDMIAGTLVLYR